MLPLNITPVSVKLMITKHPLIFTSMISNYIDILYSKIALLFRHIPTIRMHFIILIDTPEKTLENKEVVSLEIEASCK